MSFVPALKYHFLTPIYDLFLAFWLPEKEIRRKTIELGELTGEEQVLDYGCGTGSLLLQMADKFPNIELTGVDIDPEILKLAQKKDSLKKAKWILSSDFSSQNLSYDVVFASWVFHHFNNEEKLFHLKTCHDLLRKGGKLIIVDWGKPANLVMHFLFFLVQCFDSFETMKLHRKGEFSSLFSKAGFVDFQELGSRNTWFGTLKYWVLELEIA